MDTQRFERLRSIYERAEELSSGARVAYLDESCAGDAELRREVERMLAATDAPLFLERPRELDLDVPASVALPERVGSFRILGLLGEGGFGAVYRAEQSEPVRRLVALKVLHARRRGEASRLRFEAERQTLARLLHAGIAQVHDAGETEDGELFFAMELVDGLPITDWCDRQRLGLHERLGLFRLVCAAVQHAHQRGVVHRDLKPGNVLVKDEDGRGVPKVIDFGVAKILSEDEAGDAGVTREGALIGTPGYMSPEQAAGHGVDTRADVYALGALLYDLLTGDLPIARERLGTGSAAEVLRIVREEEPRRLGTAVLQATGGPEVIAALRGCKADALLRTLRGDLEWVVRRALARDPEERYATVSALSEDVERFLRHEPVSAREPAALYLARKFVARHRVGVGVVAAGTFVVAAGLVFLLWAFREVDGARDVADHQRDAAVLNEYAAHLAAARAALQIGEASRARRHLAATASEHRGWEWRHLAAQCDGSLAAFETGAEVLDVLWLNGDRVLVFHGERAEVRDIHTGEIEREFGPFEPRYDDLCHDAAGERLVVDLRSRLELWDLREWTEPVLLFEPESDLRALALAPDARTLATSGNDGLLRLFDLDGERPARVLCDVGSYAWTLAFLDRGARLALGTIDGEVQIRDVATGALVWAMSLDREDVKAIALSADERVLFAATGNAVLAVEIETKRVIGRRPGEVEITRLAVSPDGRTLYGAGGWVQGRLTAWDAGTLEVVSCFHGHRQGIEGLDVDPAGERIASGSNDGSLRVWPARAAAPVRRIHAGYDVRSLAVSADGEAFAAADTEGRITVWSARTLEEQLSIDTGEVHWGCALGEREVFVSGERLLAVDRRTGAVREGEASNAWASRLALDADGRWLVGVSSRPPHAFVWRLPELTLAHTIEMPASSTVTYEPRRGVFVIGGGDGVVRFLDPARGEVKGEYRLPGAADALAGNAVGVGPDGRIAASTDALHVFDPGSDAFVASAHATSVVSIAWSPDGQRIATGGSDTLLTLWNLQDTEVLVLDDAPKQLIAVHFVAGGERLVALSHFFGSPSYVLVWGAPPRVTLDGAPDAR